VTLDESGTLAERMAKVFSWMLALSPADRETCAQDLVDAARASFSTDQCWDNAVAESFFSTLKTVLT
jgi:hypothetical protein